MILVLAVLASACANVDFYVVFANVKVRAGLHQIIYDYEASTSALRHLYPNLGTIETRPAWGRKDEAPRTYERAIPFDWQFAVNARTSPTL